VDGPFRASGADRQVHCAAAAGDTLQLGFQQDVNAVLDQDPADFLGHVGILAAQELLAALDYRHAAAKPPEELAKLEADVAAAGHDQVLWRLLQLHDRGGAQGLHALDARQVQRPRPSAGVDDDDWRRRLAAAVVVQRNPDVLRPQK